ncbi:hypothetical protein DYB28_008744 [Aphanomyces astaci]|nr:hypothetical protein DYB28_008744 [Aphanomyces astaci]
MNDKVRKSAVLQEAITSIKVSQILPCYFVSLYSQSIVQLLTRERDELRLDRDRMKQEVSKLASCLQFSHMGSMVAANAMAMTQMPNPGGVPPTGPTVLGLFSTRAFAKMSAPIDDLLYDDDDDDDICTTHRDSHIELTTIIAMEDTGMAAGGLAQQPVAMGMLAPPSAVLAPQQMLVQPPVGVIAPPHSAMATPIAYTPSPTGPPPATTPEEKIKNLFQLIHKRFPEKYKPLHDEVRNRPMVVKVLSSSHRGCVLTCDHATDLSHAADHEGGTCGDDSVFTVDSRVIPSCPGAKPTDGPASARAHSSRGGAGQYSRGEWQDSICPPIVGTLGHVYFKLWGMQGTTPIFIPT